MLKLTAFIDGKATKLLNELVSKKYLTTYWAASPQAAGYGTKVDGNFLPNGLNSVVTIAMADWTGRKGKDGREVVNVEGPITTVPTVSDKDAKRKVRGVTAIEVPGHGQKLAEVTINADFPASEGVAQFNIKCGVHGERGGNKGPKAPVASSKLFA